MSSRVIKVCGIAPYMNANGRFIEVPSIRIQGKWVEELGFHIGSKIQVCENDGEITLKLVKKDGYYED